MSGGDEVDGAGDLSGRFGVVIPWIFAVAEDGQEGQGWWEKRKRNPKRLGEWSQAAF